MFSEKMLFFVCWWFANIFCENRYCVLSFVAIFSARVNFARVWRGQFLNLTFPLRLAVNFLHASTYFDFCAYVNLIWFIYFLTCAHNVRHNGILLTLHKSWTRRFIELMKIILSAWSSLLIVVCINNEHLLLPLCDITTNCPQVIKERPHIG